MMIGLAIVLLLLVGLLAIPIGVAFEIKRREELAGNVGIRWLFGLVDINIPIESDSVTRRASDIAASNHNTGVDSQATSRSKRVVTRRRRIRLGALLNNARLRRRVIQFVKELWTSIHKRAVTLKLWYGLEDPADTGQLCAIIGSIVQLLHIPENVTYRLEPVFTGKALELDASGDIWLRPLSLLAVIVRFLLSPVVWIALYMSRR